MGPWGNGTPLREACPCGLMRPVQPGESIVNRGTKSLVGLLASRDFLAGVAFTVIGAAYAFGSLATLKVGQASNMGPGYFPLLLSGALVVVGLLVLLRSLRQEIVRVG